MADLPVSNQLPTQEINKPEIKPRKKRVLTEAQKIIMLENLTKGREKAHILRRQMEAERKKLSEIKPDIKQEIPKEIPKEIKQEIKPEIPKEIIKEDIKEDIKQEIIKPERVVVKPKQKSYYNRRVIYEQEETDSDNDTPVVVRRVRKNKTPPPPPPKPLIARDNQRKKIMNAFFS